MASNWVRILALTAAGAAGLTAAEFARAAAWNLQTPVAEIAHGLHEYVMILVTLIFIGVFGAMFYAVYAHRKDKGHNAVQYHESTTVEILWTVIPLVVFVAIAWSATKVVFAQTDTSQADLTIKKNVVRVVSQDEYTKSVGEQKAKSAAATGDPDDVVAAAETPRK